MKETSTLYAVGAIAAIFILVAFGVATNNEENPTFYVVSIQGELYYDTMVIRGLDINEPLADDTPSITRTGLRSLGDQIVATKEDIARYSQIIRFSSTIPPAFEGGRITYTRDDLGEVGDFLTFMSDEPMFEYEMVFSPSLKSKIEDNELVDLDGESINILGGDFSIFEGEISGNTVTIQFIGDNYIEFKDDYTDNSFSRGVEINGKNIDAEVMIKGFVVGEKFILTSIIYRFEPNSKFGGDLYVPPRNGVKKYLREPEGMLTRNFEIVYGGLRAAQRARTPTAPVRRGPGFTIMPTSDESYDLQFMNNRGQGYKIPLVETSNGGLRFGEQGTALKYVEGSFVINEGDYFIVTSKEDTSGITNVLEYDGINFKDRTIFIRDLQGSDKDIHFDENGKGVMSFGGNNYKFEVSPTPPHPISVDMNRDGKVDSGEAKIIMGGGPELDIGSSNFIGGGSQSMKLTIPSKLFKGESKGDEITTFSIINDGGEIELLLSSQGSLDLVSQAGYKTGMTNFGVLWTLYDRVEPAELTVQFAGRPTAFVSGGQAQGFVIITLQLDELLALAR